MSNPSDDLIEEGINEPVPSQSVNNTTPPTSDDDVDTMVKDVIGEELQPGQTMADVINSAERERRLGKDEEVDQNDTLNEDEQDLQTLEEESL